MVAPKHVGIIPDGNRRWAKENLKNFLPAYSSGGDNLVNSLRYLFSRGVECVSFYGFSLKNFKRGEVEKKIIFKLIDNYFSKMEALVDELNLRVIFAGRIEKFPESLFKKFKEIEERTKDRERVVIPLIGYDGLDELEFAAEKSKKNGGTLRENLFVPTSVPPVDLLIRTGDEHRVSGYLTYLTTYSELYFSKKLWPDFSLRDLQSALDWYTPRERRFGE
ncbi:MAG: di-trans,poly-cis-decaprenylcistransferase [Candidatus Altiarchaeota archaeon]|nr:di-trans,poly-cis-decaprenylcistransferase [Candidatus Altiarchaeota archaeon]